MISGNLAFIMGWWGVKQSDYSMEISIGLGNGLVNFLGNCLRKRLGNFSETYWLPLRTIDLMGDNRELVLWGLFWGVIPIWAVDSLSEMLPNLVVVFVKNFKQNLTYSWSWFCFVSHLILGFLIYCWLVQWIPVPFRENSIVSWIVVVSDKWRVS